MSPTQTILIGPLGPALPSFGSDASMRSALEEINTQPPAKSKPIKLYNPAAAMTPKAGIEVFALPTAVSPVLSSLMSYVLRRSIMSVTERLN